MAMKTNKSYAKRIKITKNGKLLTRKSGQNHFNTKERRAAKYAKGRDTEFHMSNKDRSRFLVNL
ncbi:MAG: 50S ribosomal protein L35 [bacterium]|nr:50S ribosomal protein L35 [bacterium]